MKTQLIIGMILILSGIFNFPLFSKSHHLQAQTLTAVTDQRTNNPSISSVKQTVVWSTKIPQPGKLAFDYIGVPDMTVSVEAGVDSYALQIAYDDLKDGIRPNLTLIQSDLPNSTIYQANLTFQSSAAFVIAGGISVSGIPNTEQIFTTMEYRF